MKITLSLIVSLIACTIFGILLIRQTIFLNKHLKNKNAPIDSESNECEKIFHNYDNTDKNVCQDIQNGETFHFDLRGKK